MQTWTSCHPPSKNSLNPNNLLGNFDVVALLIEVHYYFVAQHYEMSSLHTHSRDRSFSLIDLLYSHAYYDRSFSVGMGMALSTHYLKIHTRFHRTYCLDPHPFQAVVALARNWDAILSIHVEENASYTLVAFCPGMRGFLHIGYCSQKVDVVVETVT